MEAPGWGGDQTKAGVGTMLSGQSQATLGAQALQSMFDMSPAAAELLYGIVGLAPAVANTVLVNKAVNAEAAANAAVRASGANSAVVNAGFDTTNLQSKLEGYLLDVTHAQNQTKATWFQQALGFDQSNWQQLASQITFNESTAVATKVTQYGQTFEQVLPISGANGNTANVTFVFMKDNTGTVRLVTGIPTKK